MAEDSKPKAVPKSGVVVPKGVTWQAGLAARLLHLMLVLLGMSLRWRWEDESGLDLLKGKHPKPVIFAIWHNRIITTALVWKWILRLTKQDRKMAAIISASRDGGFLARVFELFEVRPVRGSSSRRGAQAIRELVSAAEEGLDLAVTPDGPRGPRYVAHPGVIAMAQHTGSPILPATTNYGWKITLKSWDRFQIPLPFGTCTVRFGPVIRVPKDADEETRENLRLQLEQQLKELSVD